MPDAEEVSVRQLWLLSGIILFLHIKTICEKL